MEKLLGSKYSNVLELIQETGKVPVRCIDDGDLEQLKNEIENLGYKCRLDPSTDYLIAEKLTRAELIETLKEIGNITLNSNQVEDILPEVYEYLIDTIKGLVNDSHNKATQQDLEDFQEGRYLIDIYFHDDEIVYFVGKDREQLANEPSWGEDYYEYIETGTLAALLKAAK